MKNFNIKKLLSGKGLAVTVCACFAVVGAAGVYSYTKLTNQLNNQLISNNNTKPPDDFSAEPSGQPVDLEQHNVARGEQDEPSAEASPPETTPLEAGDEMTEAETELAEEVIFPSATQETTPESEEEDDGARNQAMVRPINGEVINIFSDGELVKSKTLNVWRTHDGVDIAGDIGEKVKSMSSGVVTQVYDDQALGVTVIIDHGDGLEGHYSNLSKDVRVTEGDSVSAGTVIGEIGDTTVSEISEPSHLHFAVRKNGEWIDPIALISGKGS
ncbi:MAG: M23 family metallopeptidase [Oscillospiraceae bacterium]|nr:M23 family metallopeptidase [Oscillospiraceae bacterium]